MSDKLEMSDILEMSDKLEMNDVELMFDCCNIVFTIVKECLLLLYKFNHMDIKIEIIIW